MRRRLAVTSAAALLVAFLCAGCGERLDIPPEVEPPAGTTDQQVLANAQTQYIDLTAPGTDLVVALGETVTIQWRIAQLPANPTVDLLYQPVGEGTVAEAIVTALPTNVQGTFDFDTSVLKIGFQYHVLVRLNSNGQALETAVSEGTILIKGPAITVTTPANDLTLIPSDVFTVKWTGSYLPVGGRLELFLDTDLYYDTGNEIAITSDFITGTGATQSGTISVAAIDLWDQPVIQRGVFYYVGARVLKGTGTQGAGYAPASIRLYDGTGFDVEAPDKDLEITVGDQLPVVWEAVGVPRSLRVAVRLVDRDTAAETVGATDIPVETGNAVIESNLLQADHSYDLVLVLSDGEDIITTRKAPGAVSVISWGAQIVITGITPAPIANEKVFVGIGCSVDITWDIDWGKGAAPPDARVKLLVDEDGDPATTADQVEITPPGGIASTVNSFTFSPDLATFQDRAGKDYYIFAELMASGTHPTTRSNTLLHIGQGCLNLTTPASDATQLVGELVPAAWEITGDLCDRLPDSKKVLRLYVDTVPQYRAQGSIEVTPIQDPNDPTWTPLDPCAVSTFSFTIDDRITPGQSYYVIGRLFVDDVEESRGVSAGRVTVQNVAFNILTPSEDVTDNFKAVWVSWELLSLSAANRKVRCYAVTVVAGTETELKIWPKNDFAASNNSGIIDASKLPPGTYVLRCKLFETKNDGTEVFLKTADAPGRIIIPDGYNGTYDLGDLSARVTEDYSPINGSMFLGFNINDQTGFSVGGLGDLDGDGFTDLLVFSRFGQEYTTGNTGSAHLIYGQDQMPLSIKLNTVAGPDPPVKGTVMLFPMENLAALEGSRIVGDLITLGLPDVSGDGKGDVFLGCPDAAPLTINYANSTGEDITLKEDHWALERTVPAGTGVWEPLHVYPFMDIKELPTWDYDDENKPVAKKFDLELNFGEDLYGLDDVDIDADPYARYNHFVRHYLPGDEIYINMFTRDFPSGDPASPIQVTDTQIQIRSQGRAGSVYLVTSQRLSTYYNGVLDLAKIGSPKDDTNTTVGDYAMTGFGYLWVSTNGDPYSSMMIAGMGDGDRLGSCLSVLPDTDGDGKPQVLIVGENAEFIDFALPDHPRRTDAGAAIMIDSDIRWTSLARGEGRIGWEPGFGGYLGPASSVGDDPSDVAIAGPENNSHLSKATGLGRFTSSSDYSTSSYSGGDFDGDVIPDVVVSTPGANSDAGTVYIVPLRAVFGRRVTLIDLADFNKPLPIGSDPNLKVPIMGVKIDGIAAGAQLGQSLCPVGDFNGDGLADIVFAAPKATSTIGDTEAGQIIILFGKKGAIGDYTIDQVSSALGTELPGLILDGEAAGDHFGQDIAAVYDVNGDGVDDLLVASPDASLGTRTGCGKVYLIYGKKDIIKTEPITEFAYVDYDGDAEADTVWNASDLGTLTRSDKPDGTKLPGAIFVGEHPTDHLRSVSMAGDVNKDGVADFLMGAAYGDVYVTEEHNPFDDPSLDYPNGDNAGKAYLIFGRLTPTTP